MVVLIGNFAQFCVPGTDFPYIYISIYARTNACYNERGSRTNYLRSSIPHLYFMHTKPRILSSQT